MIVSSYLKPFSFRIAINFLLIVIILININCKNKSECIKIVERNSVYNGKIIEPLDDMKDSLVVMVYLHKKYKFESCKKIYLSDFDLNSSGESNR